MTKEGAIVLAKSYWWERCSAREITQVQLYEEFLCMPFDIYHKNIEEAIGRSIMTHEFTTKGVEQLKKEFEHRA